MCVKERERQERDAEEKKSKCAKEDRANLFNQPFPTTGSTCNPSLMVGLGPLQASERQPRF